MRIISILTILCLVGCSAVTKPNTNYIRTGMLKDRYTALQYHYVEAGKTLELNQHNTINTYVGLQDQGRDDLLEQSKLNPYWEVNYQLTF